MENAFAGKIDTLMRRINHDGATGIVIGPEVSRQCSKVVLQSIDADLMNKLVARGQKDGEDFKIYRYVDDYFIFHNNEECLVAIKKLLQDTLRIYKLSLNKGKEETFGRPMITPITIAKNSISDLFDTHLCPSFVSSYNRKNIGPASELQPSNSSLITCFKSIISTAGVSYGDVLNYSLSIIEDKFCSLIDHYKKSVISDKGDEAVTAAMESIIDIAFFIYSVSPKVNTTIKLCRISQKILHFYNSRAIGLSASDRIRDKIHLESRRIIDRYNHARDGRIEVMYLLVLLKQLGRYYRLDEKILARCFGIIAGENGYMSTDSLDYFSIITLLFYIGNKPRYSKIKSFLNNHIMHRFESNPNGLRGDSEMVHLALDLIACPHLGRNIKKKILRLFDLESPDITQFMFYNDYWFTKWIDFDFSRELDAKMSGDVY